MNYFRLFLITLKQNIKHPVIWIIVFVMPILSLLLSTSDEITDTHGIRVLYYIDDNTAEEADDIIFPLEDSFKGYTGLYYFDKADSIEAINDMVLKGEAECGYIIPANIATLIFEKDGRDSIQVITSPSSTMAPVINETIYSFIYPDVAALALDKYLYKKSAIQSMYGTYFDKSDILELYEYNKTNGSTFTFNYIGKPDDYTVTVSKVMKSPLRGLLSLLVVISGFVGALGFYKESQNPIYSSMRLRLIYIFIPCFITGITNFICMSIINKNDADASVIRELISICIFIVITTIYIFILSLMVKSELLFTSLIPVFILTALVFTPVIINISAYIPVVTPVRYIFPNYYYLSFWNM